MFLQRGLPLSCDVIADVRTLKCLASLRLLPLVQVRAIVNYKLHALSRPHTYTLSLTHTQP